MISQTDLKYFIELSKTLHLTRSAERLAVTQPALSHSLKRLETEIGCPLFLRSKKGLKLTAAGERLQSSASELLDQWQQVKNIALNEVKNDQGVIKIGVHTAVAQYILTEVFPKFLKDHQQISFTLTHGLSRHVTEQVISSALDLAFAVNPIQHPDLIIKEICQDEVSLWKLKSCENNNVLFVEPNLVQTQNLMAKLHKNKISFSRIIESTSLEVIASLVASGAGVGIVPQRLLSRYEGAKFEKIKNAPVFNDKICLVFRSEFRKIRRGELFLKSVDQIL